MKKNSRHLSQMAALNSPKNPMKAAYVQAPVPRPDYAPSIEEDAALATATLDQKGALNGKLPLEQVRTDLLIRDRSVLGRAEDMSELMESLADVGLLNPIVVIPADDGDGFELVQGFRRLSAYRILRDQTGDEEWTTIPARILPPGWDLNTLYRQTIDENLIRQDVSYAELARMAMAYAADGGTPVDEVNEAINILYHSLSHSKRSYIRAFVRLMRQLEATLDYPEKMSRNLGIALDRQITQQPEIVMMIKNDLRHWENRSVLDELNVLRRYAKVDGLDLSIVPEFATDTPAPTAPQITAQRRTKHHFAFETAFGGAQCIAMDGKLDIKLDHDFSGSDPDDMKMLLQEFMDGLLSAQSRR